MIGKGKELNIKVVGEGTTFKAVLEWFEGITTWRDSRCILIRTKWEDHVSYQLIHKDPRDGRWFQCTEDYFADYYEITEAE